MSETHGKYDHEVIHHSPDEGFDDTEPEAKSITGFVVGSVILLVLTIGALQYYFQNLWDAAVYDNVLAVPSTELSDQRNLEEWRLTHYEYTTKEKSAVRIPLDRARALFLEEAKAGKSFYPGKPTEPKPETAAASAGAAPAGGAAPDAKGSDAKTPKAPEASAKAPEVTSKGPEASKGNKK